MLIKIRKRYDADAPVGGTGGGEPAPAPEPTGGEPAPEPTSIFDNKTPEPAPAGGEPEPTPEPDGGEPNPEPTGLTVGEDLQKLLGESPDAVIQQATDLGINQAQLDFFMENMSSASKEVEAMMAEYNDKLNPNRAALFNEFDGDTKAVIQSGQLENYLTKVSGDVNITGRVNEAFTTPEQYKILAELSQGYASSVAGAGDLGHHMGGYMSKEEYFDDIATHQKLVSEGKGREAERLMATIHSKKKTGISSLFN